MPCLTKISGLEVGIDLVIMIKQILKLTKNFKAKNGLCWSKSLILFSLTTLF